MVDEVMASMPSDNYEAMLRHIDASPLKAEHKESLKQKFAERVRRFFAEPVEMQVEIEWEDL